MSKIAEIFNRASFFFFAGELPGMQRLRLRLIFEGQYLKNLLEKWRQEVTQNVRAKAECRSAYRVPRTSVNAANDVYISNMFILR